MARVSRVPEGVDDLAHLGDSVLVVGSARGVAEVGALAPAGEVHPEGGATRQRQRPGVLHPGPAWTDMVLRARIQPDHGAPGDAGRRPGEDADEAQPAEFDDLLLDSLALPGDRRGGPARGARPASLRRPRSIRPTPVISSTMSSGTVAYSVGWSRNSSAPARTMWSGSTPSARRRSRIGVAGRLVASVDDQHLRGGAIRQCSARRWRRARPASPPRRRSPPARRRTARGAPAFRARQDRATAARGRSGFPARPAPRRRRHPPRPPRPASGPACRRCAAR